MDKRAWGSHWTVGEGPECFGGEPPPQRTRTLAIGVAGKAESTLRAVGIL